MPVIKSAKKKLRQDKKRTVERAKVEERVKDAVRKATASPTEKNLQAAASLLDKAAKTRIFHANKAARIKSRLAHLLKPKTSETKVKAPHIKTVKKTKKSPKNK